MPSALTLTYLGLTSGATFGLIWAKNVDLERDGRLPFNMPAALHALPLYCLCHLLFWDWEAQYSCFTFVLPGLPFLPAAV